MATAKTKGLIQTAHLVVREHEKEGTKFNSFYARFKNGLTCKIKFKKCAVIPVKDGVILLKDNDNCNFSREKCKDLVVRDVIWVNHTEWRPFSTPEQQTLEKEAMERLEKAKENSALMAHNYSSSANETKTLQPSEETDQDPLPF